MPNSLFSEAWHRVAQSRAKLKPEVEIRRHTFQGSVWYVLRDPLNNQYARLSPPAYFMACRLRLDRTLEQVWRECLDLYPEQAPSQIEVIYLLAHLTQHNLITSDLPPDARQTFSRYQKNQVKERQSKLLNFLYWRQPLFDPDEFLVDALPFFRPFFSRWGLILWAAVILYALELCVENAASVWDRSSGFFSPSNLFLLYAAGIVTKLWHELGHGLLCRHYGGRVNTFGAMLLLLTPLPYVDVSTSWSFPRRSERIIVAAGGMIFEFFLAAVALIFWAKTLQGPQATPSALNAFAYNVFVLSSIVTLLFNINPLLRFDGYYIFSDFVQIPNLYQRSVLQLKYLLEHYVFKANRSLSPAQSNSEGHALWIYGLASGVYRMILMWSIFFTLAGTFMGIGLVIAFFILFMWVVLPIGKFFKYLSRDPILQQCRPRAFGLVAAFGLGLFVFLAFIPFPHHFWATGIVEADDSRQIYAETSGYLNKVVAAPGSAVKAGDVLVQLDDPLSTYKLQDAQADLSQAQNMVSGSSDAPQVMATAAGVQLHAAWDRLRNTRLHLSQLTVRAPIDGIWSSPQISDKCGYWLPRGSLLGEVVAVEPRKFHFLAVVPQSNAAQLFSGPLSAWIRLPGQSDIPIHATSIRIIPSESKVLPSASLSWAAGGEIQTEETDSTGLKAKESFYLVYASLDPQTPATLAQRRRGLMRFATTWSPLLTQLHSQILQTFQERVESRTE